ncbi:MAG: chain-length determining protein, partial [Muribaculaceae bacterium]|nr:chain-length determining protein [Muribaculaceae bacterium]
IDVMMQDPRVAASLSDTVVSRLQEYITDYRTNKARKDLEYAEKLNKEAKVAYHEAQQKYADYIDKNQGIAFRSAQITRERLENEAALAFNLYNQTAQQVQRAQAKVQEMKPICAVLTPATVPVKPSSPRKVLILVGYTFLAFVACAAWILYITPMRQVRKDKKQKEAEQSAKD